MVARTADLMGVDRLGIGTDLCQDQPDSVVDWMRAGRWTKSVDYGEGSAAAPGFPAMPDWFGDNRDFGAIAEGLRAAGFGPDEVGAILGRQLAAVLRGELRQGAPAYRARRTDRTRRAIAENETPTIQTGDKQWRTYRRYPEARPPRSARWTSRSSR